MKTSNPKPSARKILLVEQPETSNKTSPRYSLYTVDLLYKLIQIYRLEQQLHPGMVSSWCLRCHQPILVEKSNIQWSLALRVHEYSPRLVS